MTGEFSWHFKLVVAAGMAITLSACEDGQGPNFEFLKKKDEAGAQISTESASQAVAGVEREVEKPDVFSANEAALWDGRPSLGGVWIAAPGVKDPERVIMRNTENGKSVVGALFRRERDNPGPRLQLSSDAAIELGVLAGAPTKLSVVALRTETVAPVAPPAPEPVSVAAPAPVETPVLKPIVEDAPQTEVASPEPSPRSNSGPADPLVAAPEPEPVGSPSSMPNLFNRSAPQTDVASPEPRPEPADPLIAAPEPEPVGSPSSMPNFFNRSARQTRANATNGFDEAVDASVDATSTATSTTNAAAGTAIKTASVTTQTLDPIEAAQAALDRADAEIAQTPSANLTPAVQTASARTAHSTASSNLAKPYIQVGIFTVQANADRAARRLNDTGVLPVVLKQESAGRTIWRVIVGPARTKAEGSKLRSKVRGLGYTDAYFVTK